MEITHSILASYKTLEKVEGVPHGLLVLGEASPWPLREARLASNREALKLTEIPSLRKENAPLMTAVCHQAHAPLKKKCIANSILLLRNSRLWMQLTSGILRAFREDLRDLWRRHGVAASRLTAASTGATATAKMTSSAATATRLLPQNVWLYLPT